ncbi:hypothetical protein HWD94_12765 [Pseudarthrobacter equi]|uniref:hypothetical protein n=1 Tax=Pseudarthrobacter TaxID=1742993 RepID=UPI0015850237|nr:MULTISPECIES: hypothetical protein [Pseudarthrobacter]MCT9625987.1 hypothetical protein [Pseudarthrobacter equi]NUT72160.1 hypothetical protein [Pseudarthrobacter sp. C4D7]
MEAKHATADLQNRHYRLFKPCGEYLQKDCFPASVWITGCDYAKLIQGILKRTADHSGLDVLRVYWYDASKDALFTDEHKSIGLLPDVKVRLGRISFNGEQKGVDLKLGLDLVGVARNRAASVAFLISGETMTWPRLSRRPTTLA